MGNRIEVHLDGLIPNRGIPYFQFMCWVCLWVSPWIPDTSVMSRVISNVCGRSGGQ